MTNPRHTPSAVLSAAVLSAVALFSLAACSSSSAKNASETSDLTTTVTEDTTAETTADTTADTVAPDTTTAPTPAPTAPPTTAKPTPTTAKPSGPTVASITANKSPNCDEVSSVGYQVNVAWVATGAASVNLSIDGPGVYQSGLPASGSLDIPGSCGDTQVVMITPIASNGTAGTPKTITIVIGA